MENMIFTYLIIVNMLAFLLYGIDKWKAKHDKWRIKEAVLLGIAAVGGCYGALMGMYVFHHKTQKPKFKVLVPIILLVYTAVLGRILF